MARLEVKRLLKVLQSLTLADVALVAYTRWAHEGGFDLSEFPAVRRWVSRVETDLDIEHAQAA